MTRERERASVNFELCVLFKILIWSTVGEESDDLDNMAWLKRALKKVIKADLDTTGAKIQRMDQLLREMVNKVQDLTADNILLTEKIRKLETGLADMEDRLEDRLQPLEEQFGANAESLETANGMDDDSIIEATVSTSAPLNPMSASNITSASASTRMAGVPASDDAPTATVSPSGMSSNVVGSRLSLSVPLSPMLSTIVDATEKLELSSPSGTTMTSTITGRSEAFIDHADLNTGSGRLLVDRGIQLDNIENSTAATVHQSPTGELNADIPRTHIPAVAAILANGSPAPGNEQCMSQGISLTTQPHTTFPLRRSPRLDGSLPVPPMSDFGGRRSRSRSPMPIDN